MYVYFNSIITRCLSEVTHTYTHTHTYIHSCKATTTVCCWTFMSHIHTHIHTYIHIYIHTYIHSYKATTTVCCWTFSRRCATFRAKGERRRESYGELSDGVRATESYAAAYALRDVQSKGRETASELRVWLNT